MFFVTICGGCSNKDAFVGEWIWDDISFKLYENGDYSRYREYAIVPYEKGEWKVKGDTLYMNNRRIDATGSFFKKYYIVRINEHQMFLKDKYWGIMEFEKSSKSL